MCAEGEPKSLPENLARSRHLRKTVTGTQEAPPRHVHLQSWREDSAGQVQGIRQALPRLRPQSRGG